MKKNLIVLRILMKFTGTLKIQLKKIFNRQDFKNTVRNRI